MRPFHEIVIPPENFPAIVLCHSPKQKEQCELHWHEAVEIIASLDSRLKIISGQTEFEIPENSVAIINSGLIHRITPITGYAVTSLSLRLDPNFFSKYSKINPNWFDARHDNEASREVADCCRKLAELYSSENNNTEIILEANSLVYHIVYLMVTKLCVSHIKFSHSHSEKYLERYQKIVRYMEENYKNPLTLNEAAKIMHLSKEHISREFPLYIGEGFREHLTNIRLIKAQELLLGSDLPIEKIAENTGFPDSRAYNAAFKKCYGISPAQYRRNYKRQKN